MGSGNESPKIKITLWLAGRPRLSPGTVHSVLVLSAHEQAMTFCPGISESGSGIIRQGVASVQPQKRHKSPRSVRLEGIGKVRITHIVVDEEFGEHFVQVGGEKNVTALSPERCGRRHPICCLAISQLARPLPPPHDLEGQPDRNCA